MPAVLHVGIILINYIFILQVHVANVPLRTFAVCSHSSIVEDDTTDVPELGPNVHGVLLLQIMTWINCTVIVEEKVKSSLPFEPFKSPPC